MKYFHKFQTTSDFNTVYRNSSYTEPWVSYTTESNDVNYNKTYEEWAISPLTLQIYGDGQMTIYVGSGKTIKYSKNGGAYQTLPNSTTTISVSNGDSYQFKGTNTSWDGINAVTVPFDVAGNIMSVLDENDYSTMTTLSSNSTFSYFFDGLSNLRSAKNLVLPATELTYNCYYRFFRNCTNLIDVPILPATTLAEGCYSNMFYGCRSLIKTPELPATTLAKDCYSDMFSYCTSLIETPELPATELAQSCYSNMFSYCTELIKVSRMMATSSEKYCCTGMFRNCTSLIEPCDILWNVIEEYACNAMFEGCTALTKMPQFASSITVKRNGLQSMFEGCTALVQTSPIHITSTSDYALKYMFKNCTSLVLPPQLTLDAVGYAACNYMFDNCISLTTTPDLSSTNLNSNAYTFMFNECTSLVNVPQVLPATTVGSNTYQGMFKNCTSLTTAPVLVDTDSYLKDYSYAQMFQGCTNLNYIKWMSTKAPSQNTPVAGARQTIEWVNGVAENGTFVMNSAATWNPENFRSVNGIPIGWTIETASE